MLYTAYRLALVLFLLVLAQASAAAAQVVDGGYIIDQRMSENLCALTFDDGPSVNTPRLLDMLNEYGIPATFFLLGRNAQHHPELVRRMVAEGHEVGNHSWSHPNLRTLSPEAKAEEIQRTNALLIEQGARPRYLRPPYGAFDDETLAICQRLDMQVVLWSLDSEDWKHLPANYAQLRNTRGVQYAQGQLHGVFLFHDTKKRTVDDLPRIIAHLLAGGCQRFVTISEYLGGELDPEPPLLMTRRSLPEAADYAAQTAPESSSPADDESPLSSVTEQEDAAPLTVMPPSGSIGKESARAVPIQSGALQPAPLPTGTLQSEAVQSGALPSESVKAAHRRSGPLLSAPAHAVQSHAVQ